MEKFELGVTNFEKEKSKFSHMKVFRVRHGDTEYHEQTQNKALGPEDLDITNKGKMQMNTAARIISRKLNKNEDIICVIASPRIRTQNGKKIVETYLKEKGFTVLNNEIIDKPQERIKNLDIYDDEGNIIPVGDENYPKFFQKIISDLEERTPKGMSRDAYMQKEGHENLQDINETGEKARRQLAGFMRVAKNIQSKCDKHIVVIQLEHCETLDDFYENASDGEYSMKNESGPRKGEIIELDIPVEGNEIDVEFVGRERGKKRKVEFDYLTKTFSNKS